MSFKWHSKKVKSQMRSGAVAGLRATAKAAFAQTQRDVPRETGALANSGRLTVDETNLRAEITYGEGLPDDRAVAVHEQLEVPHKTGQAKYLEAPVTESPDKTMGAIADAIRRQL